MKTLRACMGSRKVWIGAVLVLLVLGLLWWRSTSVKHHFIALYDVYESAAAAHEQAAFTPGDQQNPVRGSLNQALARVLDGGTSAAQRLAYAQQGLGYIDALDKQVDDISKTQPAVDAAIASLDGETNSFGFVADRAVMRDVVRLAKEEAQSIETIRALSYRANFEAAQIFKRIIADKGLLTNDYAAELNDQLPKVEDEFNQRTDLYNSLEGDISRIGQDMAQLGAAAS